MSQLFVPEEPDVGFTACTSQIQHIADVLSAIATINAQAIMMIRPGGITIYTESNHVCNAQLTIESSLFSNYSCSHEMQLGVDVLLISECFLSVTPPVAKKTAKTAADSVTCYITYHGEGHPLVIEFEDKLVSEKLEFLTFYLDMNLPEDQDEHLVINHSEIQYDLILRSEVFANLLTDLQQIGTTDLIVNVLNEFQSLGATNHIRFYKNDLNFVSHGPIGHLKLIYPSEKTVLERIQIFEKDSDLMVPVNSSVSSCYKFAIFSKIIRAVKLSTKCKLLKDLSGVLSVQLLCKNYQMTGYLGTLITFHMLESESEEINTAGFDDTYEYMTDMVPENAEQQEQEQEPLSYAAFRGGNTEVNDTLPPAKKTKRDEIKSVGGAVEVPLFL